MKIFISFSDFLAWVSCISIRVVPEFFFVISAALFTVSLYPVARPIKISPDSIKTVYDSWIKWKLTAHRIGFGFLIEGLLTMAITNMTGNYPP